MNGSILVWVLLGIMGGLVYLIVRELSKKR
ncbi:MAG: hypothetical protein G01um101416_1242 [Microgenomates group bacterium Gr01-1014_16]|nr:MAG: hypothetical protein G01um101416_1242 [Microgenomates group bacterium Gr01-1014_16]